MNNESVFLCDSIQVGCSMKARSTDTGIYMEPVSRRKRTTEEMSKMGSRNIKKGKRAEYEIKGLLYDELGITARYTREIQANKGGYDLVVLKEDNPLGCFGLDRYAIEVKHKNDLQLNAWWKSAVDNAVDSGRIPLLFGKKTRSKWIVRLGLNQFINIHSYLDHYMDVNMASFLLIARERGLITELNQL